jgi:hypothetical protein
MWLGTLQIGIYFLTNFPAREGDDKEFRRFNLTDHFDISFKKSLEQPVNPAITILGVRRNLGQPS